MTTTAPIPSATLGGGGTTCPSPAPPASFSLELSFGGVRSRQHGLRYRVARGEFTGLLSTAELLVADTRPRPSSPAQPSPGGSAPRLPWRQRFVLFCADAAASRALHERLLAAEGGGSPLRLRVGEGPLRGAAVVTGEVLALGGPAADLGVVRRRFLPVGEGLVEANPGPRARRVRMFLRHRSAEAALETPR